MYIMFAFALVFGLAATVITAAPGPAEAQSSPTPFRLVPGLSMNVKTANETFTVVDAAGNPVPGAFVSNWQAIQGEGTGAVEIVAGGQDGNNSVTVRMVVIGDAIITCDVDNRAGYTALLNAEKKWGEITRTVLESASVDDVEVGETRIVNEKVFASFLPGPVEAPAGGAKITWWLFENDDADLAQSALEDLIERFGPDNYSYVTGPTGYGEGCGQYNWWGYEGDGTFIPETLLDGLYALYGAQATAITTAEGAVIAPTTKYVTYTDTEGEVLGVGNTNIGVTFGDTGNGEAEPVIVVVLADYPLDKNGENNVCIEYIKFTPQGVTTTCQVKTPQLRWAGEKIVLDKCWPVDPGSSLSYDIVDDLTTVSYDLYAAVYSLEGESIGNLEPIDEFLGIQFAGIDGPPIAGFNAWELGLPTGADQVIQMLGGLSVFQVTDGPMHFDQESCVSSAILVSEQSGQADVNAALYGIHVDLIFEGQHPNFRSLLGTVVWGYGPEMNHGFVVYYMDFEDVVLAEDITPASSLTNLPVDEDVDVAVQVRGFIDYQNTALGPAIDRDTLQIRAQEIVDTNNDGIVDKVLPEGRWVMPDDWWAMANYNFAFRSNFDLMDSAAEDDISTSTPDFIDGPFNTDVVTTNPPGEAEDPTVGPFSTLQRWSCDLMWEASATVPTSAMAMGRNTVVPDGVMNWYDAPMPQALVTFDINGASLPMAQVPGLTGLWKSNLLGYGVDLAGHYLSPYYLVEVPSSYYIPPYGYEWDSWNWDSYDGHGPYEFWGDLMVKSYSDEEPSVENIMDVEVYSDNHGIAAMTAVALDTEGTITVTATADFPDRFLKGKYGPKTSDDIEIQWGVVEFDPDFEGVPRVCEEVEGCSVEFVNLTTGATKPYKSALWDFGDGTIPVEQLGAQAQQGQTITHSYAKAGVFDVTLTMTDANDVVAYQIEFDYITVGEGGAGNTATWDFSGPGCFPKHLPDSFFGSVQLGSVTGVPDAVQGVYYNDAGTWKFWAPEAPGTTLATLVGGLSADYLVCVTGASSWDIPLP
jgi:hypothetical protein